jgi:hypothetical protein
MTHAPGIIDEEPLAGLHLEENHVWVGTQAGKLRELLGDQTHHPLYFLRILEDRCCALHMNTTYVGQMVMVLINYIGHLRILHDILYLSRLFPCGIVYRGRLGGTTHGMDHGFPVGCDGGQGQIPVCGQIIEDFPFGLFGHACLLGEVFIQKSNGPGIVKTPMALS